MPTAAVLEALTQLAEDFLSRRAERLSLPPSQIDLLALPRVNVVRGVPRAVSLVLIATSVVLADNDLRRRLRLLLERTHFALALEHWPVLQV